jgi:hypothetical protein
MRERLEWHVAGIREKGELGRNETPLASLLVRTHTKRRVVQRVCAKMIGCCAMHMHEGSMQPGGVLTQWLPNARGKTPR